MVIDIHNHIGVEAAHYRKGDLPYAQTLEDLELKAAASGVTHCFVFPFVSYPTAASAEDLQPPTPLPDVHIPYALANRNLLTEIRLLEGATKTQFSPIAILDPAREVAAQVGHLAQLHAERPFRALKIQGTIIQSKVTALLEEGRAFLDFARERDLPFLIHSSVYPQDTWSQSHDILKVVEAAPDLRFILAHSCRFQKSALDRVAELSNAWFDCSAHRIHCQLAALESPAVAAPDDRFATDYTRPEVVLRDLAEAYPEKLIWGTDSPFYSWVGEIDGRLEKLLSSYAEEWDCVAQLPADRREAITHRNPIQWLNYDPSND